MVETPKGNRLHIGIFGRVNSGKSSLLNALTGQELAVVSEVPGTTTDPVKKAVELRGIGPCLLIDTAGFEDEGELGALRLDKTKAAASEADMALLVVSATEKPGEDTPEMRWLKIFRRRSTPVILVLSKTDLDAPLTWQAKSWQKLTGLKPVLVSAQGRQGLGELIEQINRLRPENYDLEDITGSLTKAGDQVLLVMPQDIEAPKGRLILPQVQTIRHLLDKGCLVNCCKTSKMKAMLAALKEPPALIITDSQAFKQVEELCPKESRLTSFSVLFAGLKGDLPFFVASAQKLSTLDHTARILIAEACTHQPLHEDIGRVKLPRLLRKKLGEEISIEVVGGKDFPADLSTYDLIIHCGGCMFNRKYMLSRVKAAKEQGVPMTNYGVAIAALLGILDKVSLPE
ncbi:MAG: [FeFe] hydrogenase H-cluster maturation GTPase HydF [Selenomonas sp.]|nr:[FeFe] hydrogenase H-cluster maturation GTPase HydF [Selenomonas sp.]